MNDFIKKLKEDSRFLLIVILVMAIIVLAFVAFWAGLILLFVAGFVVWIVFSLFYLRFLFDYSYAFRLLVLLSLLTATVFVVVKLLS